MAIRRKNNHYSLQLKMQIKGIVRSYAGQTMAGFNQMTVSYSKIGGGKGE